MPNSHSERLRKRALMAIVFATASLGSNGPAISSEILESPISAIQARADELQASADLRAYNFLQLANSYLTNGRKVVESQYKIAVDRSGSTPFFGQHRGFESILIGYADRWYLHANTLKASGKLSDNLQQLDSEDVAAANRALSEAIKQLDKCPYLFAKLNLYLCAASLYEKIGNNTESHRCAKVVADAVETCEKRSSNNLEQVKAANSILNSMAYAYIPAHVESRQSPKKQPLKAFSQTQFEESEKLKLRAVALADRLPSTEHLRRKAHRDLVLWYTALGKPEKAEREKQILFDLVGIRDDRILYPQLGACAGEIWWKPVPQPVMGACGMG